MSSQFNSFLATARRDDLRRSGARSRAADRARDEGAETAATPTERSTATALRAWRGRIFSPRKA